MGIILLLLIFLIVRLKYSNIETKEKRSLARSFFIVFLICIIAVILHHYESIREYSSISHGAIYNLDELYGLDDQTGYYETGIAIAEGYIPVSSLYKYHAGAYCLWNALVLVTSPFYSTWWPKICNVFLFLHLLFSLYLILRKNNIAAKTTLITFWLVAINGAFIYNSICNYKDVLLSVLILGSILLWENYLESSRSTLQRTKLLFFSVLILILTPGFRTFAVFIVLAINGYYLMSICKYTLKKAVILLLLMLSTVGIVYYKLNPMLEMGIVDYGMNLGGFNYGMENWAYRRPELANMAGALNTIPRLAVGMIRYIFFPVPFSYLNPSLVPDDFSWRNFWNFEATLVWWSILPFSFMAVFNKKYWKNKVIVVLAIWAVSYLLIYSFMYLGSGALRQKIPVYMFGTVLAAMKMNELSFKKNRMYLIGMIYPILIIVGLMWVFGYGA